MAFPTTQAGWLAYVKDWIDIEDLSDAQIQGCLDLAHIRLNRECNSQYIEAHTPVTIITPNVPIDIITEIPTFNRMRLVTSNQSPYPLESLAFNEYQGMYGASLVDGVYTPTAVPDLPQYYSIEGQKLYIFPWPAATSIVDIYFYEIVPPLLDPTQSTNKFTIYHPDLFLYACSLEATKFIVEDERVAGWETAYQGTLASINVNAKEAKLGSTPLNRRITSFSTRTSWWRRGW